MGHEDLTREQHLETSSDRSFGLVFAVFFVVIALWPLVHREMPRWWLLAPAALFAIVSVARPALLAPLNRIWTKLGILIGKIISPVALGILFYAVITPIGVLFRLAGKDPLRLKRDAAAASYWIPREPPGPPPDSMTRQF